MPSTFGWVDFAEQDCQNMADVIHLFRERDTRVERAKEYLQQSLAIFEEIKSPYAEQARRLLAELD
jgi:hypothetical protein